MKSVCTLHRIQNRADKKHSPERRKTSFLKEWVENGDLCKSVLNKTMPSHE